MDILEVIWYFGTRDTTTATDEATERLRITYDGDVGINTTTPGAQLEVKGSGSSNTLNFLTKDVNRNTVFYAKDGGQVGFTLLSISN